MLVAGLLLVGVVAADDRVFLWLAAGLDRVPGGGGWLLASGLGIVAVTTALLNLDTAIVFLTPTMLAAARRRGLDERPFLYGTIFMVNAASLFLPGSNLTNLIVVGHEHVTGSEFARRMLGAAIGAVVATALALWALERNRIGSGRRGQSEPVRPGLLGLVATAAAAAVLVTSASPALPVLAIGILAAAALSLRRRLSRRDVLDAVNPIGLAAIFGVAVALGTLAREWSGPAQLMHGAGVVTTALIGAAAAVCLNNLPAAALLSARHVEHARALLIGLNVGPNLAVSGSLSAFLWFQTARAAGARPSLWRYSRLGVVVAPAGIAGALLALYLVAPSRV